MTVAMINRLLVVLAALVLAAPARGQSADPFLSVPGKSNPPPAAPRPAPAAPKPAPAPAAVPPLPVGSSFADRGFHCPASGTVVMRQAAGGGTSSMSYGGADPGNAQACLMTMNGRVGSYLFGMVEAKANQAAEFAAAYSKVLSGPPGTVAEFLEKQGFLGLKGSWNQQFKNEALEALQIGGQSRPTVRIAVTTTGQLGNSFEGTWHRWFDVQSGALVQQTFTLAHGEALKDQDWTATRISIPRQ